jgi:3-deoxy-D-manno-octulosonic-acid transferase
MIQAGAIVQLPPLKRPSAADELTHVLSKLLADADERSELGRRAKQLVTDNRGAAEKTLKLIAPLLSAKHVESAQRDSVVTANAHIS